MVFQNPGLEALHQYITRNNSVPNPAPAIENNVAEQVENNAEIEEITKELQDEARLERPKWKGFG
ncbi:MAG: hypothetical protein ACO3HP_04725 [Candidatus Nanopelagicaceae bacterium]